MPDLDLIKQAEQGVRARRGHCSPAVRASLKPLGIPVDQFLERAAVPPTAHAEEFSVAEFCVLARSPHPGGGATGLEHRGQQCPRAERDGWRPMRLLSLASAGLIPICHK